MMTATQARQGVDIRAFESYRRDARFNALVQSTVARVMQSRRPINPEKADADAHDVGLEVAALLLQTIYEEDAELNQLKAQVEIYRDAYEKVMLLSPASTRLDSAFSFFDPATKGK